MSNFEKVKGYLLNLECDIKYEDSKEGLLIIDKEEHGIKNMVIDCEDPILIIEQSLFEIKRESLEVYRDLLQKNREIVHGAFVVDDDGKKVLFRDTLQIENLDLNELEGSLNSLSLLLAEYYNQILRFSKN